VFQVNKPEDFDAIYEMYPQAENIALRSSSVSDAALNVAKYIDSNRHVICNVVDGMRKSEEEDEEEEGPKAVKLKVSSIDSFALSLGLWAEKRKKSDRGIHRDTTYTPDPGRLREKELDDPEPITLADKIKAASEGKDENR